MKPKKLTYSTIAERLVWISVALGVLFWILESAIHVFIFRDSGLSQQLFRPELHEIWMRLFVVAMFIAFGIYAQIIIAYRRRAEEATKLAYAELDQIFRTAADGMRVVDRDFNVLRVNETFEKLTGITAAEAVGKKCYEVFRGPVCHTPSCPLSLIVGGEEHVQYDADKVRPDGSAVPCIVTATPFRGPNGDLIGIVEDFKEISERKEAEEALLRAKEDWESTFDAITDMVMLLDSEHRIIRVNRATAQALKSTKQHLVGK